MVSMEVDLSTPQSKAWHKLDFNNKVITRVVAGGAAGMGGVVVAAAGGVG